MKAMLVNRVSLTQITYFDVHATQRKALYSVPGREPGFKKTTVHETKNV